MPTAVFSSKNRRKRHSTTRLQRFTRHSSITARKASKNSINPAAATVKYAQAATNKIANTKRASAGNLPYATTFLGNQTAAIPSALQHQFQYNLTDEYGSPILSYQQKTSQLAGKRLTLSYIPATQADADLG